MNWRPWAALAIAVAMLDPYPQEAPKTADQQRVASTASLSTAMVGALVVYPHGNRGVQAKLLALARALPVVAAGDATTRAAFKVLGTGYLDAIGLVEPDVILQAARGAFYFTCDGSVPGGLPRVLNDLSHLPQRRARGTGVDVDLRDVQALRGLLRKAVGQ